MGTLELRSLSRIRDGVLLFDEVSFTVADGRVAALAGPALAGKTSLLRVIAGVERSDGGDVLLDGQSILRLPAERRHIGFLFDDLSLFEDLTVRENVEFGLRMQHRRRVDRLRRADDVLDALGLGGRAHRKPRDLSPGERKRLAFARAVAPDPLLLLLDEPTAGVEEVGREAWRQELAQALRALHVTTLIATTDLRDAVTLADDLVLMAEGQVLQAGTVARVLQGPISIEAATLAGYVPLVRGEVAEGYVVEPGVGSIAFPSGFPLRQQAAVMAHPTALFGVPGASGLGSGVSGTLLRARPDGPVYVVEVQLNDRFVALRWEWDLMPPAPGTVIEIAVRPGTLRFFNDTPAPRVRSAGVPVVDPERFAALAARAVAGADAPGPRTPQPPAPDEPVEPLTEPERAPDPALAEASATPSQPLDRDGHGLDKPRSSPADEGGSLDAAEHPSGLESRNQKAMEATATADEVDDAGVALDDVEKAAPDTQDAPQPRDDRGAEREVKETGTSADTEMEHTWARPSRPTPPTPGSIDDAHTSSYGPAPTAPPPKGDERHSGMPLD